jgi:hypothetical protein
VDRAPLPRFAVSGEPVAEDARYNNQDDEVGGDRPEADVEGPERRQERNERVQHVHPLGQYLRDDVDGQEREGGEGGSAVRRLNEDPVPRAEHHAVGGDQAEADRGAQGDQREHARVKEHEVLHGGVNHVARAGEGQERQDGDRAANCDAIDLPGMFGDRAAGRATSMLTAAGGTAASRCHGVPPESLRNDLRA